MTAIRGVTAAPAAVYASYRSASKAEANPSTPTAEPVSREQDLTRRLDSQLTAKLNHIRQQISPNSPTPGPRQVNILA